MKKSKNVDEYIANSTEDSQSIMEELRNIITSTVPEAEERIAWNVPNYKLHGVLTGFAAYTKHVSLGFSESGLSDDERKLFEDKGYKTGKGTVQIKFDQEVPSRIIKQILKSHAKMNVAKKK
ncbi:iron chaperone [Gelidibacter salicanalis]|uniref:DUF1801 domain-containing protein n=1 Tax=Gelidibacter salicanalis TaxID=291193 RepID=A0A934NJU3_9FLAO|nr:DUF1801 domain-containing protein [Gelidibacter salicanalis]MBJ7881924.1 DUF1801 domain-containing protein [Gelidibacter salicanalis]